MLHSLLTPSLPSPLPPSLPSHFFAHTQLSLIHTVMAKGKQEAKDVDTNPSEPLNSKTWVLRVSIHCEGCKKKVQKILHKIEGVERTEIDLKQQRVKVTGNVEAETLIGKLEKKMGKRPLLLLPVPDKAAIKAAPKEKKQSKPAMPKEKENPPNNSNHSNGEGEAEAEAPEGNGEAEKKMNTKKSEPQEPVAVDGDGGADKGGAGEGKTAEAREEAEEEKRPEELKESVTGPASDRSPVPEQKLAAEKVGGSEKSGGGVAGKKKKPKGQNGNIGDGKEGKTGKEFPGRDEPVSIDDRSPGPGPSLGPTMNHTSPHRQFETYPYPNPYAPPSYYHGPPAYAVSFNTAYPSSSHGAAYYAPHPPPNSYAYVHPGQESQRVPPYSDPYSLQPSDSFEFFSDENPNACSIM